MRQVAATGTSDSGGDQRPGRVEARRRAVGAEEQDPRDQGRSPRRRREGRGSRPTRRSARTPTGSTPPTTSGHGARPGADRRARHSPSPGGGNIGSSGGNADQPDQGRRLGRAQGQDLQPAHLRQRAPKSNDLVTLGKMLQEHGFNVAENAEMGSPPAPGDHSAGGFHYKCRDSGALDVNADNGPGSEKSIIDGIVARRAEARLPHDLAGGRATSTTSTSTSPTPARSASAAVTAAPWARSRRPGSTSS